MHWIENLAAPEARNAAKPRQKKRAARRATSGTCKRPSAAGRGEYDEGERTKNAASKEAALAADAASNPAAPQARDERAYHQKRAKLARPGEFTRRSQRARGRTKRCGAAEPEPETHTACCPGPIADKRMLRAAWCAAGVPTRTVAASSPSQKCPPTQAPCPGAAARRFGERPREPERRGVAFLSEGRDRSGAKGSASEKMNAARAWTPPESFFWR